LSARELRRILKERGVPFGDVFEKEELVARVLSSGGLAQEPDVPTADVKTSTLGYGGDAYRLIDMDVGGKAVQFLVDTGSSLSIISQETREMLGFAPDEGTLSIGMTAHGTGDKAKVVTLRDVTIQGKPVPDFQVGCIQGSSAGMAGAAGLLGMNFLSNFDLAFQFSGQDQKILFYPKRSIAQGTLSTTGMTRCKFRRMPGIGLILAPASLTMNSQTIQFEAIFDIGAGIPVANVAAGKALGVSETQLQGEVGVAMDLRGATSTGAKITVDNLTLFGVEMPKASVLFCDLPLFANILPRPTETPMLLAGLNALVNRTLYFDFDAMEAYLS